MTNRHLSIIFMLLIIAVGAVISAQAYWVYNAYKLQQRNFNFSMHQAVNKTAAYIESQSGCLEVFNKINLNEQEDILLIHRHADPEKQWPIDTVRQYTASYSRDSLLSFDDLGASFPVTAEINIKYHYAPVDSGFDPLTMNNHNNSHRINKGQLQEVFGGTWEITSLRNPESLKANIDSLLRHNLKEEHIPAEFYFQFMENESDSILISNIDDPVIISSTEPFKASLFEKSNFYSPQTLMVWVPVQGKWIMSKLIGILAASFFILVFLGSIVVIVIKTFLKQKKLSQMKSDFIDNITHEFKTPIANISLALQTIQKVRLNGSKGTDHYLSIIDKENIRLSNNVEKVLELSAMSNEKIPLSRGWVDLEAMLSGVIQSLSLTVAARSGSISTDLSNINGLKLYVDHTHLANIVHNLVDNALKYNDRKPEIVISAHIIREKVIIAVTDNGIGIEETNLPLIFDRFYRISSANIHRVKGFGLGLSYVKEITEAHGGTVNVKSRFGKGSVFSINLPYTSFREKINKKQQTYSI